MAPSCPGDFQCVFALSSSSPSSPRALPPPKSLTWRPSNAGDFIKYNKETVGNLIVWLSGYYTGDDDEAVIDFDKIAADGQNSRLLRAELQREPPHRGGIYHFKAVKGD